MTIRRRAATNAALLAGIAAALVAEGCAGADGPAAPSALACPAAPVPLCTDPAHAALLRAAVTDAADRIAPSLANARARTQLVAAMTELSAQLQSGDVSRARATLAVIQATLTTARADGAAFPTDAADVDAIAAAIDETARALADS